MAFNFSKANLPKQLFINNEYVDAKSTKKLSLYNPKDGSLVADDVALAGAEDVDAAVAAAEKAFPAWKRVPPTQRRDIIMKFASLIEQHEKELAELTRITLGAPYGSFGKFEVGLTAEVSAHWSPFSIAWLSLQNTRILAYKASPSNTMLAGLINLPENPTHKKMASSRSSAMSHWVSLSVLYPGMVLLDLWVSKPALLSQQATFSSSNHQRRHRSLHWPLAPSSKKLAFHRECSKF
jgi:hypothetical protein